MFSSVEQVGSGMMVLKCRSSLQACVLTMLSVLTGALGNLDRLVEYSASMPLASACVLAGFGIDATIIVLQMAGMSQGEAWLAWMLDCNQGAMLSLARSW